jgi:hypothetical protein
VLVGVKPFFRRLPSCRKLLEKIEELQKTLSDMAIRTQELESALELTRISGDQYRITSGMIHPPETPEPSSMSNEPPTTPSSALGDADFETLVAQMQLKTVGADPTMVPEHLLRGLAACLPPRPRAIWLCELYLDFPWFFRAFSRQEMVEEIFTKVYDNADRIDHLRHRPHLLAVIFFIFAIAATSDHSAPPDNEAARTYFRLGNQCLNLRCLGSSNDLESAQAIALLSQFQSMTAEKEQSDGAWFYGSMAVKLATKVCLC